MLQLRLLSLTLSLSFSSLSLFHCVYFSLKVSPEVPIGPHANICSIMCVSVLERAPLVRQSVEILNSPLKHVCRSMAICRPGKLIIKT